MIEDRESKKCPLNTAMRSGWHGSVRDFLDCERANWIKSLENHLLSSLGNAASQSNRRAWLNSHWVLQDQLARLASRRPDIGDWGIAFEYELPRERGRRPDVVILAGYSVLVLEFKDFKDTIPAHMDQVAAYARDLASYQSASHDHDVIPILVNTLSDSGPVQLDHFRSAGRTSAAYVRCSGYCWVPKTDLTSVILRGVDPAKR